MSLLTSINDFLLEGKKGLAVLIDPDKIKSFSEIEDLIKHANNNRVDYLFLGGSIVHQNSIREFVTQLKIESNIPLVLFPGNYQQIHPLFDGILFISLISGRNPEYLIGQQVMAARKIREFDIETVATGYMLVGDDHQTSVAYVSNTKPIPSNQVDIAINTAIAGELLGHKCIYLDAGSGAKEIVPPEMVKNIRAEINLPLIVGGGIKSSEKADQLYRSGADLIVIGNLFERDPERLSEFTAIRDLYNGSELSKVH